MAAAPGSTSVEGAITEPVTRTSWQLLAVSFGISGCYELLAYFVPILHKVVCLCVYGCFLNRGCRSQSLVRAPQPVGAGC